MTQSNTASTRTNWKQEIEFHGVSLTAIQWRQHARELGMSWKGVSAFLSDIGVANINPTKCRNRDQNISNRDMLALANLEPLPDKVRQSIDPVYWDRVGDCRVAGADDDDPPMFKEPAQAEGERRFSFETSERLTESALMEQMGLNPDEWIVVSFEARAKAVVSKGEVKSLEAEDGKWTGTVTSDPAIHQVWAYSLKVKPRPTANPASQLKAVAFTLPATARTLPIEPVKPKSIKRMLLVADSQIGFDGDIIFHDRDVLGIGLEIAKTHDYDYIVWTGDSLDFTQFGHYKDDETPQNTQRAIYEFAYWLAAYRAACPDATIDLIEGNHDLRLRADLHKSLGGAEGLSAAKQPGQPVMGLEFLLGLREMNINLFGNYPHNSRWYGKYLRVMHGERYSGTPGGTIAAILKDASENTIAGHSHIAEYGHKNVQEMEGPRPVAAVSLPCACKIDGTVPGRTTDPNWQQGVGEVTFSVETRLFDYHAYISRNGVALVNGIPITGNAYEHTRAIEGLYGSEW